jgi:hypothetical protein
MTRKVNRLRTQIPNRKDLIVIEESIENTYIFFGWDAVPLGKQSLYLFDTFANANGRFEALICCKAGLEIGRSAEVICVGVRFEDFVDFVAHLFGF